MFVQAVKYINMVALKSLNPTAVNHSKAW